MTMAERSAHEVQAPVLEPLYTPFAGSSLTLRNRFVMAPMTRESSPGGIPNDENVEYYRQRAAGGVGMIFTEGTLVRGPAAGNSTAMPHMYGPASAAGWREVVQAVHGEGAAIVSQLMHMGAMRGADSPFEPELATVSPSGIGIFGERVGRAATAPDLDAIVSSYVESATLAAELGFDGIEIHGGHGMVLDNFAWSRTNQRTDGYGGSLANRMKFPAEVVAAVREAVGPRFPITYRFSQWKVGAYDAMVADTPAALEQVLGPLAAAGVDIFHPSTRRHWLPAFPEEAAADGRLGLSGWVKKITGLPAIMVGSVGVDHMFIGDDGTDEYDPDRLQYLIEQFERGEFDLLALGRSLLADPEWVNKMESGDTASIVAFRKSA
ncbi:12-oxophytodienoate reductase [Nocardia sp. NPDC019395]|uniref:oxidoreductase n=1 Tax=Nocardia sp. NPDC019395 TaxID=3154686 RepID=UPI0033C18EBC